MLTKTLADLDLAAEWGRARVPWLHDLSGRSVVTRECGCQVPIIKVPGSPVCRLFFCLCTWPPVLAVPQLAIESGARALSCTLVDQGGVRGTE
jgi:hypothetical protein